MLIFIVMIFYVCLQFQRITYSLIDLLRIAMFTWNFTLLIFVWMWRTKRWGRFYIEVIVRLVYTLSTALTSIKAPAATWHSDSVVLYHLSYNNFLYLVSRSMNNICNSSQMAKSHQLPFKLSVIISLLELTFLDVWVHPQIFLNANRYPIYMGFLSQAYIWWYV